MPSIKKLLQAAAGNAGGDNLYVEDVFSTYLYKGNLSTTQTITNGIDLAGEGGLAWFKNRGTTEGHMLVDTLRGWTATLQSNTTAAATNYTNGGAFNSDGFTVAANLNDNTNNYASWTFRKAEKFFDVVTYTGTGVARTIAHNLGSVPACMIIKRTDLGSSNWFVYHIGIATPEGYEILLNSTANADTNSNVWNNTAPTDSVFSIGAGPSPYDWNASGGSYVAYLFASDAGGFGDDGSESIIKCGSYTGNGSTDGPEIDLGFEPQFILLKNADAATSSGTTCNWRIYDAMRGWTTGGEEARLFPNLSNAENSNDDMDITATGFKVTNDQGSVNGSGQTIIYIVIRRPMKTPTAGTEVFAMDTATSADNPTWNSGFVTDFAWYKNVDAVYGNYWYSRLTGVSELQTNSTAAEVTSPNAVWDFMDGFGQWSNATGVESWMLKRATGFFDVVAYTGDRVSQGGPQTITHNLKVIPELAIVKERSDSDSWYVASTELNNYDFLTLNTANLANSDSVTPYIYDLAANNFKVGARNQVNATGDTYISYLFATVAGVSKVGSYTGTGADLNVDCGFSAGARFILIKRTDSTGDWYVYDSERGIVAGNDPYFLLNSNAAQVTNTDYIDPLSSGFTVTSSAPAALNASGGTYIFLSIA
jgi:hypothetical protein